MTDSLESARPWIGRWLRGTGLVNVALAVVAYHDRFAALASAGGWNAVAALPSGALAVWCLFAGVLLVVVGGLADELEHRQVPLPQWLGWALALCGLAGGVLMPYSTSWLLLPPAVAVLRAPRPVSPD